MPEVLAKLSPPRIHNIYEREGLFEKLDAARKQAKVIWISAPAGSGKTTLIASYLQTRKIKPIWYQVDEGDADLSSFYYYLGLAVKQYAPRRQKLPLLSPEYQQGIPAFTRHFFREFYPVLKSKGVLVFDNTQDAGEDAELLDLLTIICQEIPENVQVIFISRSQYPASLASMQVTQELVSIDWKDLKLTQEESVGIASYLLGKDSGLGAEKLIALYEYTDGWTTGFILYLRQLAHDDFNLADIESSHLPFDEYQSGMFDYFANELFNRLDKSIQYFLAQVVWLEKITIKSADRLSKTNRAKSILSRLEKDNYFVTRKGFINSAYEFHPLFRQYLISQSLELFDSDTVCGLKSEAANLLASAGNYESAAKLYIETENWLALKEIILTHAGELEKQGRQNLIAQWLELLPVGWVEQDEYLLYWLGITNMHINPFDAYEQFNQAFIIFEKNENTTWCFRSWLGLAESLFLRTDEYHDVVYWIEKLEVLRLTGASYPSIEIHGRITIAAFVLLLFACPQHEKFSYWLSETKKLYRFVPIADVKAIAGTHLAMYYTFYAKTSKLVEVARKIKKFADSEKIQPIPRIFVLWTEISAGWISVQPHETEIAIQKAIKIRNEYGVKVVDVWIFSASTFSSLINHQFEKAQQYLDMMQEVHDPKRRFSHTHFLYLKSWLQMENGQEEQAFETVKECVDLVSGLNLPFIEGITLGTLAIIQSYYGMWDEAKKNIDKARLIFKTVDNQHLSEFCLNYVLAWLELKRGNLNAACESLARSFSFANRENQYAAGWFIKEMKVDLCLLALQNNIEVEYTRKFIKIYNLQPDDSQPVPENWPYPVKIHTLGRFSLLIDGEPMQSGRKASKKAIDIIKAIIALGGRDVSAQSLSRELWPDQEGDASMNAFTTTLHRLRKFIEYDAIIYENGRLSLDPKIVWVDIWEFEQGLNKINRDNTVQFNAQDPEELEDFEKLIQRYQGPFLKNEDGAYWALSTCERLHQKLLRALLKVCKALLDNTEYELAKKYYQYGLEIDDLNEYFYQGLIRCSLHMGNYSDGMQIYQRCRDILLKRLDICPSAETEALRVQLQK